MGVLPVYTFHRGILQEALCKFCIIFETTANRGSENRRGRQDLGKLAREVIKIWEKVIEDFQKHQEYDYHKCNALMANKI